MLDLEGRPRIRALRNQQIREVANAAIGSSDILAFWFGEPDLPTPEAIRAAGAAALMRGDTFYTPNLGLPELRQDLAAYLSHLHRPISPDRIAVTSSAVSALMISLQAIVEPGGSVV
ncbi:MAG: aminotransferase class I/II-fold pyridoxal phosphate-dependent enzyme, partial [Steroidobacteraceae bacterium]